MISEEIKTPYMQNLIENANSIQPAIEHLLEQYRVLPVGKSFIDLIVLRSEAIRLINDLEKIDVAVEALSWWCLCQPGTSELLGCPHGGGGPKNRYGEGWFSECYHYPLFEVTNYLDDLQSIKPSNLATQCAQITRHYMTNILPSEPFFKDCLHPGLWLLLPDGWARISYLPVKNSSY